jgi:serine phosphatase RsbU (regulator of sigma subunit)
MIARIVGFLRRLPRGLLTAIGLTGIAVLAMIDYFAPPDLSFLIFYVAPVLFLVWFVGRWAGFLGAAVSAGFWAYEDVLVTHAYGSSTAADWNIAVRLLFLVLFVYVVAELKRALERERQAAQERLERDVHIAEQVQSRLFPQVLPDVPGLECHGICLPARGVAGDYYDFLMLEPGRIGIAVGDVAGKGLSAALLMASLQGALRSFASVDHGDPAALAGDLNAQMYALTEVNRFATFFWAVYDEPRRALTYTNAGHNAPMLLRTGGALDRLQAGGPPLGAFAGVSYRQERLTLSAGDLLLVFTDGITEAPDPAEQEFGEERLERVLREHARRPLVELCQRIIDAVATFEAGAPQQDDITIVVARARAG